MIYSFDHFELDTDKVELRAAGAEIPLEPQVFALLLRPRRQSGSRSP